MNDDSKSDPTDANAGANPPPPPADGKPGADSGAPAFDPNRTVMRPKDQPADVPVAGSSDTPPPGAIASDPDQPAATGPTDPAPDSAAAPAPSYLFDDTTDGDGPIDTDFPTKASKAGSSGAIVAVGTGLLAAAVVIGAFYARADGDLDWSNFGIGIGATAVLLGLALFGSLSGRRTGGRAREEVVTWPGVVGILGAAVMLNVGIDKDDNWLGYVTGGLIIGLSAIGYLAARRAAFTVTGLLGLAIIYGLLFDDLLADSLDDNNGLVVAAAVVGVFVIGVTVLGWLLPSRAVTGVVVGAGGVVAYVAIMLVMVAARFLGEFFGGVGFSMDDLSESGGDPMGDLGGYSENDVWWVLALAAVLTVMWALAASVSNHPGFSILAIVMPALLVPLASVALAAEHPSRWSAVVAAAGGVLLLGGLVLARLRGKAVQRELPYGTTR